jgi:hypothetical protein
MADEMATTDTPTPFTPTPPPVLTIPPDEPWQCGRCGSHAIGIYGDFCFNCGASAPGMPMRGGPKKASDSPPTS